MPYDLLLAHAIKKPKEFLYAHPEYKLSFWQNLRYKYFLYLYKKSCSIAAITGHKEFYGLDFFVNKNVLIPRPDTELMVAEAIEAIQTSDFRLQLTNGQLPKTEVRSPILLIDVGTGSGCIPISIACHCEERSDEAIPKNNGIAAPHKSGARNDIQIIATDISRSALRVAKKNAKTHKVKINFLRGNLLEPIIHNSKFIIHNSNIVITANLPYLTEKQFQDEPSIQREPKTALVADKNGLALYEELLKQIASFCHCEERSDEAIPKNNGIATPRKSVARNDMLILLEIDPSQTEKISKFIKQYLPNTNVEIKKDLAGRDRLVKITK